MKAAALLLASVLFPAAGAAPAPMAEAKVSFAEALVAGELRLDSALHALRIAPGHGNFSWILSADSIRVNWTREEHLESMAPPDFDRPLASTRVGKSSGEAMYNHARASSQGRRTSSELGVAGGAAGTIATGNAATAEIRPLRNASGESSSASAGSGRLAEGLCETLVRGGSQNIRGDLTLVAWEANVTVRAGGKEETYRSGDWTEPIGPVPAMRRLVSQTVRLTIRQGLLELESDSRPFALAASEVQVRGPGSITFRDVSGNIQSHGSIVALERASWTVPEFESLRTWNESSLAHRVSASLVAPGESLGVDWKDSEPLAAAATRLAESAEVRESLLGPSALVIGGTSAWFLTGRLRAGSAIRLDDVELALLQGRPGRARRLAQRRLRSHPGDPDTAFLLGASYLGMGRPSQAIAVVEPLLIEATESQGRGLALLLARAERELGGARVEGRVETEESRLDPVPYIA